MLYQNSAKLHSILLSQCGTNYKQSISIQYTHAQKPSEIFGEAKQLQTNFNNNLPPVNSCQRCSRLHSTLAVRLEHKLASQQQQIICKLIALNLTNCFKISILCIHRSFSLSVVHCLHTTLLVHPLHYWLEDIQGVPSKHSTFKGSKVDAYNRCKVKLQQKARERVRRIHDAENAWHVRKYLCSL